MTTHDVAKMGTDAEVQQENRKDAISEGKLEESADKQRIMRNVIFLSLAFFCHYTSMLGLAKLQSSLHYEGGLGVISTSVFYISLIISSLFLPRPFISLLGHKWVIAVSFCGNMLWMLANGHATWFTMITTSIIIGPCASAMWTAQGSYITLSATRYAQLSDSDNDSFVATRFFGIFLMFYQFSDMIGTLISSVVLKQPPTNETNGDLALYCGMEDCPSVNRSSISWETPDSKTLWIMIAIYLLIALVAIVILILFVDQLPEDLRRTERKSLGKEVRETLLATWKHMRSSKQLLLIPFTVYTGVQQSFWAAEFTKSFITCTVGIWMIGIISFPYGIVNGFTSFLNGAISKYTGRLLPFLIVVLIQLMLMLTLYLWTPSPSQVYVLFIVSCFWGFTDAVAQIQLSGLYVAAFELNIATAFANYQLWEALGYFIAYAYSAFICTSVKGYILIGCLVVGTIGYLVTEYFVANEKAESNEDANKMATPSPLQQAMKSKFFVSEVDSSKCVNMHDVCTYI